MSEVLHVKTLPPQYVDLKDYELASICAVFVTYVSCIVVFQAFKGEQTRMVRALRLTMEYNLFAVFNVLVCRYVWFLYKCVTQNSELFDIG